MKRVIRNRPLSQEEAVRYQSVRDKVEKEFPPKFSRVEGDLVRIYSKEEQDKMRRENQDIVFHRDGWIISYSAGH